MPSRFTEDNRWLLRAIVLISFPIAVVSAIRDDSTRSIADRLEEIALVSIPLIIFLFIPRRLPRPVRSLRYVAKTLLRSPPSFAATAGSVVLWDVLGLVAVLGAFAFLEWRSPYYFVQDDVLVTELPSILVACRGVWDGYWPEWNPYVGMGIPLMSAGLYSLTYPPLYLSYAIARNLLGSEYAVMDVFALLHLLVFWLCRRLCSVIGCAPFVAALASLSFVLSGPILVLGRGWHTFIPLVVWLPALGLCFEALRRKKVGWRWLGGAAVCLAMPVHVGFPQLAVVSFGLFCGLLLALKITRSMGWTPLLWGVAAVLLGLSLSAPVLQQQMSHGKHTNRRSDSDPTAVPGLAAMFFPAPLVTAPHPHRSPVPDFTPMYFFGGLLAWCWAAGILLAIGSPSRKWTQGAGLWWWAALAFLILSLGDSGSVWCALRRLPLLSTLARRPLRMVPIFAFCATVSGSYILDRLWRRLGRKSGMRMALGIVALALIGQHLTQIDTAMAIFHFRPYPAMPRACQERLCTSDVSSLGRVCSCAKRFAIEGQNGVSLSDSLAGVYKVFSTNVSDPVAEYSPTFRLTTDQVRREKDLALRMYGVRWVLVNHADLDRLAASDDPLGHKEQRLSNQLLLAAPWNIFSDEQLRSVLKGLLGDDLSGDIACGPIQLFELSNPAPLAFCEDSPARGLPFRVHTEGVDVDVSTAESQEVTINFLRLADMRASVDRHELACATDEWGRMVINVPQNAKRLMIRYRPRWYLGGIAAAVCAALALATIGLSRMIDGDRG